MKLLMYIPLTIMLNLLQAFVLRLFWGWFVLTQWVNAPNLSMAACFGLSCIASLAVMKLPTDAEITEVINGTTDNVVVSKSGGTWDSMDRSTVRVVSGMIMTLSFWFMGYIAHLFM